MAPDVDHQRCGLVVEVGHGAGPPSDRSTGVGGLGRRRLQARCRGRSWYRLTAAVRFRVGISGQSGDDGAVKGWQKAFVAVAALTDVETWTRYDIRENAPDLPPVDPSELSILRMLDPIVDGGIAVYDVGADTQRDRAAIPLGLAGITGQNCDVEDFRAWVGDILPRDQDIWVTFLEGTDGRGRPLAHVWTLDGLSMSILNSRVVA